LVRETGGLDFSISQIRFNPESNQGAVEQMVFRTIVVNDDGHRNVPYCNQNGSRWDGNWNWLNNRFNANDRVAVAGKWQ
jgi:hypothetical protein